MTRLLFICIVILLLYMGFTIISEHDTHISFTFLKYQIDTSLFTFLSIIIIQILLILISIKIIISIFDLPNIIQNKLHNNKFKKSHMKSIQAFAQLVINNKSQALNMMHKIVNFNHDYKDINTLICLEKEEILDRKINYLQKLLDNSEYNNYALRTLAVIFYDKDNYLEAEKYAVQIFNDNESDTHIILLLIRIYAKLRIWSKFIFVIPKLQRANYKIFKQHSAEIANYYYQASQDFIANDDDAEAMNYLQSALELKVDHIDAITLYTELKINVGDFKTLTTMLKSAYSVRPNFQIAELFIKTSKETSIANYDILASLSPPAMHYNLCLALASFLNLPEKAEQLRQLKGV